MYEPRCSHLVLQSRHLFGVWPRSPMPHLFLISTCFTVRCLPRSRGVPTSFNSQMMMFSTNRGTPQYYSPLNQIKGVAWRCSYTTLNMFLLVPRLLRDLGPRRPGEHVARQAADRPRSCRSLGEAKKCWKTGCLKHLMSDTAVRELYLSWRVAVNRGSRKPWIS